MPELIKFLGDLMPDIVRMGWELYKLPDGNLDRAREDIKDRSEKIKMLRRARDLELKEKYK